MESIREQRIKKVYNKCEEIRKMLNQNDIYADVEPYYEIPAFKVIIYWGDWKHSHAHAKWLIEENIEGVTYINTKVVEDDGSDCYSAEHRYVLNS